MAGERILLVDDDNRTCQQVRKQLIREGFDVSTANTGAGALRKLADYEPQLVILDISLLVEPGNAPLDGIDVLQRIREDHDIPVMMLSATSVGAVKVMALTMGADDYMTKPFDAQEFVARVRVLLRRTAGKSPSSSEKHFPGLVIDPESRRVWKEGLEVSLTAIEFELLWTLARRPNRVYSREQLIELAWRHTYFGVAKVVDVHIGHIRKKIESDPACPKYIVTVRGVGYRFSPS